MFSKRLTFVKRQNGLLFLNRNFKNNISIILINQNCNFLFHRYERVLPAPAWADIENAEEDDHGML